MKLLPLVEGWDGACSGLDGPLVELLPLGEGWDGARFVAPSPWGRLGWGSYVGWYAPPETLNPLLHLIIYIPFGAL